MSVKPGDTDATAGAHDRAGSDAVLLAACTAGDAASYRALVDRYLPLVLSIARRMLRDDTEAEDVAQETMLRLWRNAGRLDTGTTGIKSWLCRVASNLCIDRIRSTRLITVDNDKADKAIAAPQVDHLNELDVTARVDVALKVLPERQRQALVLFHYEGLSQLEISNAMEVSIEAVESLIARGRRRLKVELEPDWRQLLSEPEPEPEPEQD